MEGWRRVITSRTMPERALCLTFGSLVGMMTMGCQRVQASLVVMIMAITGPGGGGGVLTAGMKHEEVPCHDHAEPPCEAMAAFAQGPWLEKSSAHLLLLHGWNKRRLGRIKQREGESDRRFVTEPL